MPHLGIRFQPFNPFKTFKQFKKMVRRAARVSRAAARPLPGWQVPPFFFDAEKVDEFTEGFAGQLP